MIILKGVRIVEIIVEPMFNVEDVGCTPDCCIIDCDFCGFDGTCIDIN